MLPFAEVAETDLPEVVKNERFYEPGDLGTEQAIRDRLINWWGKRYGKPTDD